jgi:hypothetical protein
MAVPALSRWRSDSARWLGRNRADLLILTAVWLATAAAYFLLARGYFTPRHQQDEFLYWALSKSFAAGDGFSWRGIAIPLRPFLYPVSISPAFHLAGTVDGQYNAVHAINALMMCATAFPAFLMARLLTDRAGAYIATAFALLVPAMNYIGLIGTEPLAYPACTAAIASVLLACARPRTRNTLLALALIGVAIFVRVQFVILVPVFFAAIFSVALMRGRDGARAYIAEQKLAVSLIGLALATGLMLVLVARSAIIGIYGGIFSAIPLTADNALFWSKSFAADTFLVVGVVPAIATFALVARRTNRRDPLLGALIAVAVVTTFVLVAQVAWFSATSPAYWRVLNLFYERYIFYLGPIFFTGLVAARGKVSTRAAIITSVLAVVVISGFQADALATPFSYEAFGLTYLGYFVSNHNGPFTDVGLLAAGVSAVLALAYVASVALERRPNLKRYATALAIGLPLFMLVITQARAWTYGRQYAADARAQEPQPVDFVARAASGRVGMIVAGGTERNDYFQDEFWNPNMDRLYVSAAPPVSSPRLFTPFCRFGWDETGLISSRDCPGLPSDWYLRSKRLAMHLRGETKRVNGSKTATLIRAPRPARISSFLGGRDPVTGAIKSPATITTFLERPGVVRVAFVSTGASSVELPHGRTISLRNGETKVLEFRVPSRESMIALRVKRGGGSLRMPFAEVREGSGPWRSLT